MGAFSHATGPMSKAEGSPTRRFVDPALLRDAARDRMLVSMAARLLDAAGILVLVALAWAFSADRRRIPWRAVAWGLGLQLVLAVLVFYTPPGRWLFEAANGAFLTVTRFAGASAAFVFGGDGGSIAGILAVKIGAIIIFFASLMSVLYHLGVMPRVVRAMAWIMARTMGTSGAESLSCAANIFVGQTEAPLFVRPYIAAMTRSELMSLMTGGFATIAGSVMGAYVAFGADAGHLLTASVMSAPAALMMAKIMMPESETPQTLGTVRLQFERRTVNVVDAAASGAADGLRLALNVTAMLLAFVALIYLVDFLLGCADRGIARAFDARPGGWTLAGIFGTLLRPIGFLLAGDWRDAEAVGSLLGTQVAANEFLAYQRLTSGPGEPCVMGVGLLRDVSPRTFVVATYALCGFANFGSVAIQLGGIGALAPERRGDLARIGLRAMLAGALACWLTACVAGLVMSEDDATYKYERLLIRKEVAAGRIDAAADAARGLDATLRDTAWQSAAAGLSDELSRARRAASALGASRADEARALLAPLAEDADLHELRAWAKRKLGAEP